MGGSFTPGTGRGGTGRDRSPPRPLLAVPNVTGHPSMASIGPVGLPYCYITVRCSVVLMCPQRVNRCIDEAMHGQALTPCLPLVLATHCILCPFGDIWARIRPHYPGQPLPLDVHRATFNFLLWGHWNNIPISFFLLTDTVNLEIFHFTIFMFLVIYRPNNLHSNWAVIAVLLHFTGRLIWRSFDLWRLWEWWSCV